jgi:hypothetical protein
MNLTHWNVLSVLLFMSGPGIQSNHKGGSEEFEPFPRNCIRRKFQIRWKSNLCGWWGMPRKVIWCQLQVPPSRIQGSLKVLQSLSLTYEERKCVRDIRTPIFICLNTKWFLWKLFWCRKLFVSSAWIIGLRFLSCWSFCLHLKATTIWDTVCEIKYQCFGGIW